MTANFAADVRPQVGDLVFVLSDENQTVLPATVVEEIIQKNVSGESISWKIQVGPNKTNIIDTKRIKGTIYTDLREVRTTLLRRLYGFMDDLFQRIEADSQTWYGIRARLEPLEGSSENSGHDIVPEKTIDPETLLSGISRGVVAGGGGTTPPPPMGPVQPGGKTQMSRGEIRTVLMKEILEEDPSENA